MFIGRGSRNAKIGLGTAGICSRTFTRPPKIRLTPSREPPDGRPSSRAMARASNPVVPSLNAYSFGALYLFQVSAVARHAFALRKLRSGVRHPPYVCV